MQPCHTRTARNHGAHPDPTQAEGSDEQRAASLLDRYDQRMRRIRSWAARWPGGVQVYRVAIAAIGFIVIVAGIVLLVIPGPGWLLIFTGLGIWATEFAWAKSLLRWVGRTLRACIQWLRRLPTWFIVVVIGVGLAVIAAVLAYLLN